MLISHYIEDLSPPSSENVENQTYDENHPTAEEEYLTWNSNDTLPEDGTSSDPPLNSNDKLIINNLDTWSFSKILSKNLIFKYH